MKRYIRSSTSINFAGTNFTKTDYYIYQDRDLYRNVKAGLIPEHRRPYRVAGNYNLYIDSFPSAALPYSKYYIADKITGDVYQAEIIQGLNNQKQFIADLVDYLKSA